MPLPCLDSGQLFGPGAFPPAARSPAGRGRLGTSYGTQGTVWEGRCMTGDGGSRSATRRCGGRGGASPFLAKDRRTWGSKARTSTRRSWGCDSRTWIGRGSGGGMLWMVRWSSGGSGERRLGVGAIPAKEGRGLDRIRSGG
jgi:hypothetical protein